VAHRVELRISSDPRWLRMARRLVEEFSRQAGFDEHGRQEIIIGVDEALSNVMRHAYRGETSGPISLICEAEDGRLEVVLKDQGQAFAPGSASLDLPDPARLSGRGSFLIHSTMDEVEYRRAGEDNLMRLRKYLKEPAGKSHG